MRNKFIKFLINQLILTAAVYLIGFVLFKFFLTEHFFPFLAYLPLFFYLLNSGLHIAILKISGKNMKAFTSRFMGIFGVKIIVLLIFIVLYSYFNPSQAVSFLITFFILYVIYTAFEVIVVLRYLKNK